MNRHSLTTDTGREVDGPVVFLDAYDGWVRETGQHGGWLGYGTGGSG